MSELSIILSPNTARDTRIRIFELCINGESLFQRFIDHISHDGNLIDHLAGAIRIVEDTANLNRRPKTKFRELKNVSPSCKVYEAKYRSIRIYLFHEEKTGRVILTGGLKNNQDRDIKGIRKIISTYHGRQ